ncbi:MAG: RNase P subunit p30 family protein [Candidatus Diapherotrites archaeon]
MIDIVFSADFKELKKAAEALGIYPAEIAIASNFPSRAEADAAHAAGFKSCKIISKRDSNEIKRWHAWADYVAVFGGTPELNKFGVSKGIDFLLSPCGTGRLPFDTALAQSAHDSGTTVAVLFSDFLGADRQARSFLLRNWSMVSKICKNRKAEFGIFSGARNALEMRSPQNLGELREFL